MLNRDYNDPACSIAGTLGLIGERWTLVILREVFLGRRRFSEMQRTTGVARNILSSRLDRLVDEGILERRPYSEHPERHEYLLTHKGLDLWPVLVDLLHWGDKHLDREGEPPLKLIHKDCGGEIDDRRICESCGKHLGPRDARAVYSGDPVAAATA
ncbi:MAG: transcriptional regulator [Solirubrobacterales bacterium]|nr:transcriptional regulator [Solirubrobacterales bacterium]